MFLILQTYALIIYDNQVVVVIFMKNALYNPFLVIYQLVRIIAHRLPNSIPITPPKLNVRYNQIVFLFHLTKDVEIH